MVAARWNHESRRSALHSLERREFSIQLWNEASDLRAPGTTRRLRKNSRFSNSRCNCSCRIVTQILIFSDTKCFLIGRIRGPIKSCSLGQWAAKRQSCTSERPLENRMGCPGVLPPSEKEWHLFERGTYKRRRLPWLLSRDAFNRGQLAIAIPRCGTRSASPSGSQRGD